MENLILAMLIFCLGLLIIVPMIVGFIYGAPWVPTNASGIKTMIAAAELKQGMVIIDPGCGDGRILFRAVNQVPGLKAIGYELFIFPYVLGKVRSWFYPNVEIYFRDSRKADLSEADVIFCYMMPETLEKLGRLWLKKLSDKAAVISYAFEIKPWRHHMKIERIREKNQAPIHIYHLSDQKI